MLSDKEQFDKAHVKINTARTNNDLLLSDLFRTNEGHSSIKHVLSSSSNNAISTSKYFDQQETIENKVNKININKPRRKRRVFSCDNCRKLKTKCVNNNSSSTCERCKRLRIECNLPSKANYIDNEGDSNKSIKNEIEDNNDNKQFFSEGEDEKNITIKMNQRLINVENNISTIENKLNKLIELQTANSKYHEQSNIETTNTHTTTTNNNNNNNIDSNFANNFIQNPYRSLSRISQDGSFHSNTEVSTPSIANFVDLSAHLPLREDLTAPLNIIGKIQTTLIGKKNNKKFKSDFVRATDKFIKFYLQNELLCLELAKEYLEVSHYYIIPGGISVIDRDYVLEHPFITCVFVLIALKVSKKYKNTEIRNNLEEILKNIVSSINCKEPLTDHDIESILYVCMYDIGGFDNWLLSTTGLMHYFLSIDSRGIIDRVVNNNNFNDDDLFHLRILNALCSCHLQISIGLGRSIMIDDNWWKVHKLTVIFPNATIGDGIQVAQLDLFKMLIKFLKEPEYFNKNNKFEIINKIDKSNKIFQYEDLNKWKKKWEKILIKDNSKISSYSYNFAYILVARKIVYLNNSNNNNNNNKVEDNIIEEKINIGINTVLYYSFNLLNIFLESKAEFIKGIPSFQLWEVVYGCVSLFENLSKLSELERKKALNMISKTYWHLNKMGQELNDATGTIAEIVKKLVEMANKNQVLNFNKKQDKGFIGTGSVTKVNMYSKRKNSQQQKKLSPEDLPIFLGNDITSQPSPLLSFSESPITNNNNNYENNNHNHKDNQERNLGLDEYRFPLKIKNWPSVTFSELRTTSINEINDMNGINNINNFNNDRNDSNSSNISLSSVPSFQIPDLSNFNSFDEFFKDLFDDYPQKL